MKTRYKVLILNLVLTTIYYFGFRFFLYNQAKDLNIFSTILSSFYWDSLIIVNYNWIHTLWISLFVIGLFKRNRELIFSGVFAILLSIIILFIFMLSYQI
jgi:hypothetical protein